MSEAAWRRLFQRKFGPLDVWRWRPGQDNMPQPHRLPRAKDFDDAARAIVARHRENKLRETLKIALSVLRDDEKPAG